MVLTVNTIPYHFSPNNRQLYECNPVIISGDEHEYGYTRHPPDQGHTCLEHTKGACDDGSCLEKTGFVVVPTASETAKKSIERPIPMMAGVRRSMNV